MDPLAIEVETYYFRMKWRGNEWKVEEYFSTNGLPLDNINQWVMSENVPKNLSTLNKIKTHFNEQHNILSYVVEAPLFAPTRIYQVVVKFREEENYHCHRDVWRETKKDLFYTSHYSYS